MKVFVAAAEYPGHVIPEIALAGALCRRGHQVLLETAEGWRDSVEATGARLLPVEDVTGVLEHGTFDATVADAARALGPHLAEFGADVVVSDSAVAAPPLAAEVAGIPNASLIPTVYPVQGPGLPPYPLGLRSARTAIGRASWRAAGVPLGRARRPARWLEQVPGLLDEVRGQLGLAPMPKPGPAITSYGALSDGLTLVATFPHLEYPRRWPANVHVTGPMLFERPYPDVEIPEGAGPLVLVASSTAQDPERTLLAHALDALSEEPVRVIATINDPGARWPGPVPANATVADWLSYRQVMARASLVITSGGHGTLVRALAEGVPVLVSPSFGDQPENGARLDWAGAGLMLPKPLLAPGPLRWATRRILGDARISRRARELAAWAAENDGADRGAELVEELASRIS